MKYLKILLLLVPVLTFGQTITLKGSLTNGNSGTDIWEYIDANTGNVYAIVGGNGMSVVDVTDPTTPVQVAHLTNVPGFDVKVWDHYAYCGTSGGGTGRVVDLSDPTNPQIVGSFPSPHNIFIDERGYMFNSSPGVRIYDLNPDPTSPLFLIQVGSGGHDVTVRGNLMIDCHGGSGTNLYDVTDPAAPILLSSITDPTISYHHQGDISTDGNYLYICDEGANHPQADISVWNISDINNPFRVSDVADPTAIVHNLYVIGDYAYASYYTAGFKVFDITDPSQLVLADVYDTNNATGENFGGAFGVYPSPVTANIYINDNSGVYIFGFSELGVFAKDVGVNNIITPVNGILTNAEVVEIGIRNFGLDAQSNIPLELRVDGNLVAAETFTGTINAGDTATYQFTQTVDLSTSGQTYTIEAKTILVGDEFTNNDDFTKEVTHLLNNDIGVLAITSPVSGSGLGIETISITIKNFGASPQSNFEVQYILDGGSPVVETFTGTINSEEELSYDFSQTADFSALGTYNLSAKTLLGGDGDTSNDEVSVVIEHVICQPSMDCSFGDGFQLFQIEEINNPSGCEGYGDFTHLIANLSPGNTYDLTITTGYGDQFVSVWIDYNDDYVYTANELVVDNYVIAPGQGSGTYTETMDLVVPANATLGEHTMRAKTNWNAPVPPDACEVTQYGETEDYTANIGVLGLDDLSIAQADLIVIALPNNRFNISLITSFDGKASVSVFNMLGQQLSLNNIFKEGDRYNLDLDMSGVSSGIYLIKMGSQEYNIFKTARIIVK
ncbi:MAG: choice-of-anchor B family protein [Bacteroidetes bacterium]|nr:MAG: choice-of-anchor B family protein [Bacteroidota bacterium]